VPRGEGGGAGHCAATQGCARAGERRGGARRGRGEEGEGEREREEKGGELTRGPNSGDRRLQSLGHHGEREVGEGEGGCCAGNPNERGRGGGHMGRGRRGRAGRAGLGWAGSHHGSKPTTRTTIKRNPIANRNPKQNETNTRHQTKKCASA
jgi:hypothetical protein